DELPAPPAAAVRYLSLYYHSPSIKAVQCRLLLLLLHPLLSPPRWRHPTRSAYSPLRKIPARPTRRTKSLRSSCVLRTDIDKADIRSSDHFP
ncbi:hypothetical protein WOLCODRAFT_137204, partial [Wolfiporia cocos MD-104 SS10]